MVSIFSKPCTKSEGEKIHNNGETISETSTLRNRKGLKALEKKKMVSSLLNAKSLWCFESLENSNLNEA